MKSGSLAIVNGDLQKVESVQYTVEKEGFDAAVCLDVGQGITNLSGETLAIQGIAAEQEVVEQDSVNVADDGSISVSAKPRLRWKTTEFLLVPDDLIISGSGSASFLYNILKNEFGIEVEEARIHLQSYREKLEDESDSAVVPWKIGFYGRDGNADNGVVHGVDLLDDGELGEILGRNSANQLGLRFDRDGQRMKIFLTESGWAEVYQPNSYDTSSYVEWVTDHIRPHIKTEF